MMIAGTGVILLTSNHWLYVSSIIVLTIGGIIFLCLANKKFKILEFIKTKFTMSKKCKQRNHIDISQPKFPNLNEGDGVNLENKEEKVSPPEILATGHQEARMENQIQPPLKVQLVSKIYERSICRCTFECNQPDAKIICTINGGKVVLIDRQLVLEENSTICVYAEWKGKKSDELCIIVNDFKVQEPAVIVNDRNICFQIGTIGSRVYYTLDGSTPSLNSNLYEGEFAINKSCNLKAVAIKENWKDSDVISQQISIIPTKEERVRKFTNEPNVIGISYRGDSHIKSNSSCQDYHYYEKLNTYWNLAIVSDGAGSAKHSDEGSRAVCAAFSFYIKKMIEADTRFSNGDLLDSKTWDIEFKGMLTRFQNELRKNLVRDDMPFESFAATIIILLFSSKGFMVAHVGDGRAGVKINGEWRSIMSPHKGEEANQTIFSTSKYFGEKYLPNLKMSNVYVPEINSVQIPLEAFVLMSDGCENGAWMTYQRKDLPNGDFKVEDVNQPRGSSLDLCLQILDIPHDKRESALIDYITSSSNAFINEPDDKTILTGIIQ